MSISSVSYNNKIISYTYTKVVRVVTPEEWVDMGIMERERDPHFLLHASVLFLSYESTHSFQIVRTVKQNHSPKN